MQDSARSLPDPIVMPPVRRTGSSGAAVASRPVPVARSPPASPNLHRAGVAAKQAIRSSG